MSTAETLQLLDRLRSAVRDLTSWATEVKRDYITRSTRSRVQYEQALGAEPARWSLETETEKTADASRRQRVESAFAARQERIVLARENTRKRRSVEIEDAESKRTVQTQHGLLDADRTRDAENQNNQANHQAFIGRLAEEQAALEQLEAGMRSVLGGQRALAAGAHSPAADQTQHENQIAEQLHQRLEVAPS